jgi:predicted nucleotidyltransferase
MRARGPGQSTLLLLDATQLLAKESVDYAVVGALAAAVHGAIRATTDADALLSIALPRLGSLARAFKKAGFEAELRRGDSEDPIVALLVLSDRHGNRVDLLAGLRGLDPQAFSRLISVPFQGATLRVIGREDFIAMKCFAGGPQDIADAREALQAHDVPVNVELLRRVTRRFGRAAADALEGLLALT